MSTPSQIAARFAFAYCLAIFIFIDVPGYIRPLSIASPATAGATVLIIIVLVLLNFLLLAGLWFKNRWLTLVLCGTLFVQFMHTVASDLPPAVKASIGLALTLGESNALVCLILMRIESQISKSQLSGQPLQRAIYIRDRAQRFLSLFNAAFLVLTLISVPVAWKSLSSVSNHPPAIAQARQNAEQTAQPAQDERRLACVVQGAKTFGIDLPPAGELRIDRYQAEDSASTLVITEKPPSAGFLFTINQRTFQNPPGTYIGEITLITPQGVKSSLVHFEGGAPIKSERQNSIPVVPDDQARNAIAAFLACMKSP